MIIFLKSGKLDLELVWHWSSLPPSRREVGAWNPFFSWSVRSGSIAVVLSPAVSELQIGNTYKNMVYILSIYRRGCCVTKLFLGRHNTHVYSPQIENQWQTKVKLGWPWVLLGLFTGIWVRGYLQEQKFLKDNCITLACLSTGDSSVSWEPRALQRPPAAHQVGERLSQVPLLSWTSSGSLAAFCCFQGCPRVFFAAYLCERNSQLLMFTLTGRSLVNPVSFRNFREWSWVVVLLFRMDCFSLGGNCYITLGWSVCLIWGLYGSLRPKEYNIIIIYIALIICLLFWFFKIGCSV